MRKVCLVIALLMIVMMGLVSACSESNDVVHVDANVKEASLAEVWKAVVEEAGIRDVSANLSELSLRVDEDGSVELLHYMFYARDADGKAGMYSVNSEYDGDVTYYWYPADGAGVFTTDPLGVFEEMDKVPATTMLSGEASAHVLMSFQSGAYRYNSSVSLIKLYHMKDGELVPLKDVMFRTSVPWGEIHVSKGAAASTELWFLTSELGKAESVEYA